MVSMRVGSPGAEGHSPRQGRVRLVTKKSLRNGSPIGRQAQGRGGTPVKTRPSHTVLVKKETGGFA